MPFSYYKRLSLRGKRIYRESNKTTTVGLPPRSGVQGRVKKLARALKSEDRQKIERACRELLLALVSALNVSRVRIKVLAVRPTHSWGELHGIYESKEGRRFPVITVWTRTARRHQVVAFRTFLRTLIHEFCHHLDYSFLSLADSLHTEGFYKRESSLVHQLIPPLKREKGKKLRRQTW